MTAVNDAFEVFQTRLEITASEQRDASRRQQEVRGHIQKAFAVDRDFLTGSYARHTKTKPLKDVDIFFVLGSDEHGRRDEAPSKIIDAVYGCLVGCYDSSSVERGRRCVTVSFEKTNPTQAEGGQVLSVDVVPAFALGDDYEIPDNTLGEWIETNPEVHKQKATDRNAELDGHWVPLVKMLKAWNLSSGKPIKPSFLIEVMALDLVDAPFHSYPDAVRRFWAAAAERVSDPWPDPAGLGPLVSDQMTHAACEAARVAMENAEKAAARAARAETQGRNGEAISIWRELMGPYFPAR